MCFTQLAKLPWKYFCFATQTCWLNLVLSAQTYHPLVRVTLQWKQSTGKDQYHCLQRKNLLWNARLHSSDSKHRLLPALCKLSAWIFLFHLSINDILVSPHLKQNENQSRSTVKVEKVPSITEAREVSCSYSNTNILIFIQNSPSALKAAQTHTPALWQQMVQFKARKKKIISVFPMPSFESRGCRPPMELVYARRSSNFLAHQRF